MGASIDAAYHDRCIAMVPEMMLTIQPPRNSRRACRTLVALALVVLGTARVPLRAATGPRIEVDSRELWLGEVVKGEVAEARIEVRNSGDEVLEITSIKPG